MNFLKNLSETFNDAVDFVIEKNKKFNKVSKIRRLMKQESNSIIKAYITLGKHYYNDLRDVPNYDMQKICDSIDSSKKEIEKLKEKLEEIQNDVNLSKFEVLLKDENNLPKSKNLNNPVNSYDSNSVERNSIENSEDSEEIKPD